MPLAENHAPPVQTWRRFVFWLLFPVAMPQGLWLRRHAPRFRPAKGPKTGRIGSGPPLRLLAVGDSIIAGVGASTTAEALPSRWATAMANHLDREIHWCAVGRSGAGAVKIRERLLPTLPSESFDAVFVSVGVNDVTALYRTHRWRTALGTLLDGLRAHSPDALIVLAGLPPLHGFPLLPQPLRFLFGLRARTFDEVAAQEVARRPGCRYAPTQFDPKPELFAPDGYHPSPDSYRVWGEALAALIAASFSTPAPSTI